MCHYSNGINRLRSIFIADRTLNSENDTVLASLTHGRVVVDHTLPVQLQRSAKLKISHWFYWSVYSLWRLHLVKKHLKKSFCYTFFTHSQRFNEMFIFSSKSSCSSGTFITSFLHRCWQRIFNETTDYFSDVYIQHFLRYVVWNFHLNRLTFVEAMTDVLGVHFLSR